MRFALLTCLLAAPMLFGSPAWAQAPGETVDVAGWKIHNDKNADGSQTCVAMWKFDDESMVGFGADTNKLTYLIVSEPEAELTKDQQIQVKYKVDGGKQRVATGIATSKVMVVIPISSPDTEFAAFGAGTNLVVDFGGDSYEEPLGGSKNAIKALGQCIGGAMANP